MQGELNKLPNSNSCTGCGACITICPQKSIIMSMDEEGFYYPVIKEDCMQCGLCERVCPVLNRPKLENLVKQEACCAIHNDKEIWRKSSSGGAFSAICELFGDKETIVCGAEYNENEHIVQHECVTGIENIAKLRGSKYVQSQMGDIFTRIREYLREGKKVIFVGTPCQVAALRNSVKNVCTDSLLCVDLVCHGVGSPGVFKEYNALCEKKEGAFINEFCFRNKEIKNGRHELYSTKIIFSNGKEQINTDDIYINLFLQKIICRKSCSNCQFTSPERMGDLTIADFKKMYSIIPNAPANRNGSTVICNTEKGKVIFNRLFERMLVFPCTIEDIENSNQPFTRCIPASEKRSAFFYDYKEKKDELYMWKYIHKKTVKQLVMQKIPDKTRAQIKKLISSWIGRG